MSTPPRPRRPVCPAILVCDRVVARAEPGRFDVLGMFDALVVPAMPVRLSLTVSFALTEGEGEYELPMTAGGLISLRVGFLDHEDRVGRVYRQLQRPAVAGDGGRVGRPVRPGAAVGVRRAPGVRSA